MLTELKTASCNHFGLCGGCTCVRDAAGVAAPPPYAQQLEEKEAHVRQVLSAFSVKEWRPILPSPDLWYYRNKMEYAFGLKTWTGRELVLGLRQAGKFDRVVDLETCLLMSPESVELIARARAWAWENNFSGYDRGRHNGDLRYLVVREGKNTGERMAILVCSATAQERIESALPDLTARFQSLLTTFLIAYAESRSDMARGEKMQCLFGPGTIQERLNGVQYRISPYAFFQTNSRGTEQLYRLLADWGKQGSGALMDLYCGAGGIALSLAGSFDRVIGVDINAEAIEDAQFNSQLNRFQNTKFVASDTEQYLKSLLFSELNVHLDAVVVDPPRPGLHPKALKALLEVDARRVAYVSCNPESLSRDLQGLIPFYNIHTAQVIDLFPHTPHVETLVTLEHR